MQIVIDISDEQYEIIKKIVKNQNSVCPDTDSAEKIILNGTLLPKGHGRLIDADNFLKDNEAYTGWILNSSDWGGENAYKDALEDLVNDAPTIIEADKAESEGV